MAGEKTSILLDRVGRFDEARTVSASVDVLETLSSESVLGMMWVSGRIEATHDSDAVAYASLLERQPDLIASAVGEYWQLHMAAHGGSFAASRLHELAILMQASNFTEEVHWVRYMTLRMHVDSARHLYLSGTATFESLATPKRRELSRVLRKQLAVAEAFDFLYSNAHFIAHVLLPRFAIYDKWPTQEEADHIAMNDERPDINVLIDHARLGYKRARNLFAQYGDREALYLQADELNLEIVREDRDLRRAAGDLDQYGDFIDKAGHADIYSYPHLYRFRLYVMSYYDSLLGRNGAQLADADTHLESARRELKEAEVLDRVANNSYGLYRIEFLRYLLRLTRKAAGEQWLKHFRDRALQAGYFIEADLLEHIARRRTLTSVEVMSILRFYPIVHQ